jgi:hypothetical protein
MPEKRSLQDLEKVELTSQAEKALQEACLDLELQQIEQEIKDKKQEMSEANWEAADAGARIAIPPYGMARDAAEGLEAANRSREAGDDLRQLLEEKARLEQEKQKPDSDS